MEKQIKDFGKLLATIFLILFVIIAILSYIYICKHFCNCVLFDRILLIASILCLLFINNRINKL